MRPDGFTINVLEAFPHLSSGAVCLVVQSNEDGDLHRSEVNVCEDFATEDPRTVFEIRKWVYSIARWKEGPLFAAHSGGSLLAGDPDDLKVVANVKKDVSKLWPSSRGVFVIGLGGYIGHFDGKKLVDLKSPSKAIYAVAEAPDGTVYAAGASGGLFRREGSGWSTIKLPVKTDITRLAACSGSSVLFAGPEGVCGRADGTKVTMFQAPDPRPYYAIAMYKGRIFVGAGYRGLEVVDGTKVVPFKENVWTFHIATTEQYMFASGRNELARYDGESWVAAEFT